MFRIPTIFAAIFLSFPLTAEQLPYRLQAGDVLDVSLWGFEHEMRRQVLVLPDGTISYPLTGEFRVAGMTLPQLRTVMQKRIAEGEFFGVPPRINISVKQTRALSCQ